MVTEIAWRLKSHRGRNPMEVVIPYFQGTFLSSLSTPGPRRWRPRRTGCWCPWAWPTCWWWASPGSSSSTCGTTDQSSGYRVRSSSSHVLLLAYWYHVPSYGCLGLCSKVIIAFCVTCLEFLSYVKCSLCSFWVFCLMFFFLVHCSLLLFTVPFSCLWYFLLFSVLSLVQCSFLLFSVPFSFFVFLSFV